MEVPGRWWGKKVEITYKKMFEMWKIYYER